MWAGSPIVTIGRFGDACHRWLAGAPGGVSTTGRSRDGKPASSCTVPTAIAGVVSTWRCDASRSSAMRPSTLRPKP